MKYCIEENCNKSPGYNFEGNTKRLYCKLHKIDGMVDVKTKKCIEDNCKKQPCCNFENESKAIYCSDHKKENMINVISNRCQNAVCSKLATYGYEALSKRVSCLEHKTKDMIDLVHKKCHEVYCDKRPNYNFEDMSIGIYCKSHAKENMIDVEHPRCKECNITRISNSKYKGLCLRCFMFQNPNEKIVKNYKIKENHITNFLKTEFKNVDLVLDKQVNGGCSGKRPDCYIDKYTHILIIEVDEEQHNNYDNHCENKRTMQLFQDFGNRPLVIIRFNPDSYVKEGKKFKSCFKVHKVHGIPIIDERSNWANRLEKLKESVNKWLVNIPTKEVTTEFLFYSV